MLDALPQRESAEREVCHDGEALRRRGGEDGRVISADSSTMLKRDSNGKQSSWLNDGINKDG